MFIPASGGVMVSCSGGGVNAFMRSRRCLEVSVCRLTQSGISTLAHGGSGMIPGPTGPKFGPRVAWRTTLSSS